MRKWCRLAGAPKHNRGRCDVGYGDRHGYGVETDDAQAIPYYQQAADQGCPIGAYWLAYAYEHGEGVKRDRAKARHWYDISSQRGDQDAAAALARLSPR